MINLINRSITALQFNILAQKYEDHSVWTIGRGSDARVVVKQEEEAHYNSRIVRIMIERNVDTKGKGTNNGIWL